MLVHINTYSLYAHSISISNIEKKSVVRNNEAKEVNNANGKNEGMEREKKTREIIIKKANKSNKTERSVLERKIAK